MRQAPFMVVNDQVLLQRAILLFQIHNVSSFLFTYVSVYFNLIYLVFLAAVVISISISGSYITSLIIQSLSKRFLNVFKVGEVTVFNGKLFH